VVGQGVKEASGRLSSAGVGDDTVGARGAGGISRESAAKRVWIYFNNDRDGYAIKNASQLMGQLKVRPPHY